MKTSELTGAALNWAVAKAMGWSDEGLQNLVDGDEYPEAAFSTNWAQGGPILERERIKTFPNVGGAWSAQMKVRTEDGTLSGQVTHYHGSGPTPLIAAMRCFVVARLGDEVEPPEELQ